MFRRLWNLVRGFFGLFVSGMERRSPEALLEVEKENLRAQIAQFNQGLASHAALCERLMSQVKRLESDEREQRAKTTANLKAGNRDSAGQYAVRLQATQRELTENRTQLEQAERTYQDLVKARDVAVTQARQKIDSLKSTITDLKVQKAMAELNEMAAGMVSTIGGSGDTLNRLEEMVKEDRDKAAGRARVARDQVDMTDVKLKESEQKAMADQALADFAATEGIALEPAAGGTPAPPEKEPTKTMGPSTGTPQAQ
jgi:phage shock protein A